MGMGQNPIPLVNIKIAGKWMFIPLKMVLIGIDPYPHIVEKSCTTKRMVETLQWDMGRINQQSTGAGFRNHPQYWEILGIQLVNDAWWMISHTTPCFFGLL